MDYIRAEPNFLTGSERDRYDGPILRFVFSPSDRVEMDLEWVARVGVLGDPDFGDVSDSGDVTLRAKTRLLGGRGAPLTLGVRFGVTLPETSYGNGLGPNALRMSAQVLASLAAGETWAHANAGLAIHDEVERPHEQRDFLAYGLAVGRRVGRLDLLGELAGRLGEGRPGAEARSEARVGVRVRRGRVVADAALRRGLASADGTWGVTGGLSVKIAE